MKMKLMVMRDLKNFKMHLIARFNKQKKRRCRKGVMTLRMMISGILMISKMLARVIKRLRWSKTKKESKNRMMVKWNRKVRKRKKKMSLLSLRAVRCKYLRMKQKINNNQNMTCSLFINKKKKSKTQIRKISKISKMMKRMNLEILGISKKHHQIQNRKMRKYYITQINKIKINKLTKLKILISKQRKKTTMILQCLMILKKPNLNNKQIQNRKQNKKFK